MDGQTLTILASVVVCLLVVVLRPGTALGVIIASMFLWPEYLRFPIGIAQMSVPRMGAVVLFLRMVASPGPHPPRLRGGDLFVIGFYLWMVGANLLAGTPQIYLKTIVGSGFDTILMYLVGRRVFSDPGEVKGLMKGLVVTALAMAPIGLMENVTRWSPYLNYLYGREGVSADGGGSEIRLGMRRAFTSTEQPIFFGMGMLLVTSLMFSCRRVFETRTGMVIGLGASILAVLTSLSSGPWMGLVVFTALNALYWAPQLIKPGLAGMALLLVAVEALSNRHFYHLIDYFALDRSNAGAYYRSRLMEVAVKYLGDYWVLGYGGRKVDYWGPDIDGRTMVDMVNNYIIVATTAGIFAMFLYIGAKVAVLITLIRCYQSGHAPVRPVAFGLAAGLVALSFSELSVGLYGPPLLLSFVLMGCSVSCAEWVDLLDRKRAAQGAVSGRRAQGAVAQPAAAGVE